MASIPFGYAFAIDFYRGKHGPENRTKYRNQFGLAGEVVLDFLDYLETQYGERKFSLYFDNFFTSIELLEHIQERGTWCNWNNARQLSEKCAFTNSKVFSKLPLGSEEHFEKIFAVG